MSIFLENRDVFNLIVSKWLTIFDLVRLDRAICSTEYRPYFLSLLQTVPFRLPYDGIDIKWWKAQLNCIQWLTRRQMYHLRGPLSIHHALWLQLLPPGNPSRALDSISLNYLPFFNSLRELRLIGFLGPFNFAGIAAACPKLIHLYLLNLHEVSPTTPSLPETLESLYLENVRFTPELFQVLVTAPKLKHLTIRYCDLFLNNRSLEDMRRDRLRNYDTQYHLHPAGSSIAQPGTSIEQEETEIITNPFDPSPPYDSRMKSLVPIFLQRLESLQYIGDLAPLVYLLREFGPANRLASLAIDIVHSSARLSKLNFPALLILSQCRSLRSLNLRRMAIDFSVLLESISQYNLGLESLVINHCRVSTLTTPSAGGSSNSSSTGNQSRLTSLHLESLLTTTTTMTNQPVLEAFFGMPGWRQSIKKLSLSFWTKLVDNHYNNHNHNNNTTSDDMMMEYEYIRQQLPSLDCLVVEEKKEYWTRERLGVLQQLFRHVSQVEVIGYSGWCPTEVKHQPSKSGRVILYSKNMTTFPSTI